MIRTEKPPLLQVQEGIHSGSNHQGGTSEQTLSMKVVVPMVVSLSLAMLGLPWRSAADLTENLVVDGGMEHWETVTPTTKDWWEHLTRQKGCTLSYDGQKNILMPRAMEQCGGCKVMQRETGDVHGGKSALRLMEGLYIRVAGLQAVDGDVLVARFWVKGQGPVQFYPHSDGEARVETLELVGKADPERWSLIEQRMLVASRGPARLAFRLVPFGEMLIDEVFLARVIRTAERKLEEVPADCQERIAFAAAAEGTIALDGKLDEPVWGKAVAFGGFRSGDDQMFLADVQPSFRVLFDRQTLYLGVAIPLPGAQQVLEELKRQPLLDGSGKPRSTTDTYTSRESVEVFLQAPGQSGYRQFVVSLDGYRYDGSGQEGAWNGAWSYAIHAADDRWFLEMQVPVKDLGIEKVEPAEGWRLNLCCNQRRGSSTWAAVGPNFHSPDGFGRLIAQDFDAWHARQPEQSVQKKAGILQAAGAHASRYAERLAAIDASGTTPAGGSKPSRDWETITRIYSQMDFIGYAYRCVEEEIRYANFFQ